MNAKIQGSGSSSFRMCQCGMGTQFNKITKLENVQKRATRMVPTLRDQDILLASRHSNYQVLPIEETEGI